jgi:putative membrane protein
MSHTLSRSVRRGVRRALAAAFLALAAIGASAQQSDQVVPPAAIAGNMSAVDEAFALFAASGSLAEIEGARLVLKTTRRADVRDYAQKLTRDHGNALEALRRIVAPRGLKLPPTPTGRHADLVTKLGGVEADARDEAFLLRFGVDAHKETITLFERHAAEGVEPGLKRHAAETLPHLREHLAAAMKLMNADR